MKHWCSVIFSLFLFCALPSLADTTSNANIQKLLDDEAAYYVNALKESKDDKLLELAIALQDSGITSKPVLDEADKVARAQHNIFNADKKRKDAFMVASSLARFLAGTGTSEYFPTLEIFMYESNSRSLRNLSKTLMTRTGWYMDRNRIMNNFSQHQPENSLFVTRYLNLLNASDLTYGRYAAESMTRQGNQDKVLVEKMAAIVKEKYKTPGEGNNLDAIAWYLRFLGRSGPSYRSLLTEVADYPKLHKKLKKHVKLALKGE